MLKVEIIHRGRKDIISAMHITVIDEPLQCIITDTLGEKVCVDCRADEFYYIHIDGETVCTNPNIKRR